MDINANSAAGASFEQRREVVRQTVAVVGAAVSRTSNAVSDTFERLPFVPQREAAAVRAVLQKAVAPIQIMTGWVMEMLATLASYVTPIGIADYASRCGTYMQATEHTLRVAPDMTEQEASGALKDLIDSYRHYDRLARIEENWKLHRVIIPMYHLACQALRRRRGEGFLDHNMVTVAPPTYAFLQSKDDLPLVREAVQCEQGKA